MKVLVAVDGAECARTALDHVMKSACRPAPEFHLLHVIVPGFADAPVSGIPDVVAQERLEEEALLANMSSALKEQLGAKVTSSIVEGEIATVTADACKTFGADEVIVPSHARHGFSRLWFGSVADQIVDAAPCTVVVLKIPQATNR